MIAQLALAVSLLAGAPPLPQPDSIPAVREDPWVSPDKAKHFLIAGFVESASFAGLEAVGVSRRGSFAGAFALTAGVSLLREIKDKRSKNQFSLRDLTWDFAGGLAAFVILRHTERP